MTIREMIDKRYYGAVFILARYFYRIGSPIISDAVYDTLENVIRQEHYSTYKEYLERSYDDDPVPFALLKEIGVTPVCGLKQEDRSPFYSYLNEDKSFSIASVTSYEEAYPFFMKLKENKLNFVVSLKVDGVNTKMLYVDGKFALSLSRGRADGNSFDYTDNSAKILPRKIRSPLQYTRVTGESFVKGNSLPYLRRKYEKENGYVTSKSAAISMLRVEHDIEDYDELKTMVFYAEGLSDTLDGTFCALKKSGFNVVPHIVFWWEDIPDTLENFKVWAKSQIFDRMWALGQDIPSDGVVIEVNDLNWLGTQKSQYVDRQLALKFEQWSYQVYSGKITGIKVEQRRVNKSFRIEIEPMITSDGSRAQVINSFNPSIVIDNDLFVGKTIYFERNSNAFNSVIYGERLKDITGEADE